MVLPPASGLRDTQKLQERPENRHLSSIKSLKGPRAGWEGGREAGGHTVVPEGIHSLEVLAVPLEGRAQSVGVERERGAGEEGR